MVYNNPVMRTLFFVLVFVFAMAGPRAFAAQFDDYWYSGKAEITSYELSQARYGAKHPGYALLIFVTEDFSRSKHVKLDDPVHAGRDAVKVLKLNLAKKFNTGIYRYSTMSSVFAPVSGSDLRPLKVTLSSGMVRACFRPTQDICRAPAGALQISLPTGTVSIVPGLLITRLLHTPLGVERAEAGTSYPRAGITRYSLFFPETDRVFEMDFETAFPHKIVSWREVYKSGWGDGAKRIETSAVRKKTIFSDYWNKNSPPDARMRKDLGIEK